PSNVAMVPLWGWVPEVAIYNTAVLLALTLSAYGMYRLARELTGDTVIALLTGMLFTAVPYQFAHLQGHLHLIFMGWVPLFLVHVVRLLEGRASLRDGVLGGLFLAVGSLESWYNLPYAFVGTAVLAAYGVAAGRMAMPSWRSARVAAALVCT